MLVVGDHTIYTSQLKDRTESSASKLHAGMPLLSSVPVTDAMHPPRILLEAEDSVADSLRALIAANRSVAAVVESGGIYRGAVTVEMLSDVDEQAAVGGFADRAWPAVFTGASMEAAAEAIVESGAMWVPALDDQRHVVGVLDLDDVFGAYRTALESNYRHFARVTTGATLIDAELDESSRNVGKSIANAEFPPTTLILSIRRNDQLIFPQADTILEVGDRASILTDPADIGSVKSAFQGAARDAGTPPEEAPPLI